MKFSEIFVYAAWAQGALAVPGSSSSRAARRDLASIQAALTSVQNSLQKLDTAVKVRTSTHRRTFQYDYNPRN